MAFSPAFHPSHHSSSSSLLQLKLSIPPPPRFPRLDSLPSDILLCLFRFLDLRSIARLALSNRAFAALARSDLLWRPIVARLVGPWIHFPRLSSPLFPPPPSPQPDWTLEPNFLPLLPQSKPSCSTHSPLEQPIASWYQYATRFLLPNFNYLGWHMSDQNSDGRLVLVTLDTHTGRLVAEEIVCLNAYSPSHYAPRPSPFALLSRAFLPTTRPALPDWLPTELVNMLPSGTGYTMRDGRAHAGFQIDLFAPALVSLPWFSLGPFAPRCVLASEPARGAPLGFEPLLSVRPFQNPLPPSANAKMPLACRTDIRHRAVLAGRPANLVSRAGADAPEHHCFVLSATPTVPSVRVPPADGARIIYQDPPVWRSGSCALWAGGRAYVVGAGGQLVECVGADERQVGFHALDGPPPIGGPRRRLKGIWVGCYGTHGCEFGKLVVERVLGLTKIRFIKVTGDVNVPAGEVSWTAEGTDEEVKGISRQRAVELDCTQIEPAAGGIADEEGWVKGQGRVANQMFREPQWINVRIQLIKKKKNEEYYDDGQVFDDEQVVINGIVDGGVWKEGDYDEEGEIEEIEEIRVKWIELNCIMSFWKVLG